MEHRHLISSVLRTAEEAMTADGKGVDESVGSGEGCGVCAICLDKIALHEMALVKGCEHAYCIHDYMFEERVCLLLRAHWFALSIVNIQNVEPQEESYDELEELLQTEVNQELDNIEQDESYYVSKVSIRIGNRRWGCNGYIRTGRKEARPIAQRYQDDAVEVGPSYSSKEAPKGVTGRRAKRAMKREVTNKATAEGHASIS